MAKKTTQTKIIVPLERSEKMIETMEKAGIDLGLTPRQAFQVLRPTNPEHIRERVVGTAYQDKKTKKFVSYNEARKIGWDNISKIKVKAKYVPGRIFELKLISIFGWNWRSEIVKTEKTGKEIAKTIRLWYKLPNGDWNYIEKTGGAAFKSGIDDYNREKAAETDAFKRCCIALGFFADVYAPMLAIEDRASLEGLKEIEIEENNKRIVEPTNQPEKKTYKPKPNEDTGYRKSGVVNPKMSASPKQKNFIQVLIDKLKNDYEIETTLEKPVEILNKGEAADLINKLLARGKEAKKKPDERMKEQHKASLEVPPEETSPKEPPEEEVS